MANNILTATLATVKLGHLEFEGLMFEDGSYGIGVPQICSIFQFPIKHASRDIKALLGKDFQFPKARTTLHPKAVNVLQLIDFEKLLRKLDRKGIKAAQEITDDLIGLSLTQLFSDAFGKKFEKEERQNYLLARQQGKKARMSLTDGMKAWGEKTGLKPNYGGATTNTYRALFGKTKKELLEELGVEGNPTPRDFMTADHLSKLEQFENYAAIQMTKYEVEPLKAVKLAKEFYT